MKSNFKSMTMAAGVFLMAQAAAAQVNLNLHSTTSAVTKTAVNTSRVTNAVTKTAQVTGKVVQNTGKIAQGTTSIASKSTANVQANIKAATNVNARGRSLIIENESTIGSNVVADTKGKSELVKETVVSEAQEIREMPKEMRREVKPGLNLKSETSANTNASAGKDGITVNSEAKSSTQADVKTGVNKDKTNEKITDAKDKTEQKTKHAASKIKKTKVKAEASAGTQTTASASNQ